MAIAQIAYAISTITGAKYSVSTIPSGSNITLAAPTTSGGGNTTQIAFIGGGGNASISVPSGANGYAVVELQNTAPLTVSGSNLTIIANTTGGSYNVGGNTTLAIGGGNNVITTPTPTPTSTPPVVNIAIAGDGTNTVDVTGSGQITGGTGTNTIITTDPPAAGFVINSEGTNDVVVPFGLATVTASGPGAIIWSSSVSVASSNQQLITISGAGDAVAANAVSDTITATGTNDDIYGNFSSTGTPLVVSIGGSSASAGSGAEVAIFNSNATVNVGASASNVLLLGNFGSVHSSLNATLNGAGGTVVTADSNATITTGAATTIFGGFTSAAGALNVTDNNLSAGAGPGGAGTLLDIGTSAATVNTNGAYAWVYGSFNTPGGGLTVNDGGNFDTIDAGQSNLSYNSDGSGRGLVFGSFGVATTVQATLASNANVIDAANSAVTATEIVGAINNTIYGGFGASAAALAVSDGGFRDVIDAGSSAANVSLSGTGATVYGNFGGSTALSVDVSGGDTSGSTNYVITGDSSASVTASAGTANLEVNGGSGTLSFVAVASGTTSTVWGGSGNTYVTVGAGSVEVVAGSGLTTVTSGVTGSSVVTLFGSAGSDVTYMGSAGGALYFAGSGNETLNAALSSANQTLWGGSGADSMVGGSGNDTLVSGTGNDTMTGGAGTVGASQFIFLHSATNGNSVADVVNNFSSSSTLELYGYGSGSAAYKSIATVAGGATLLTLSDNTTIKFTGVTNTSLITTHIITG
jgi:hypothetical protein